jgi:hypothetical protein
VLVADISQSVPARSPVATSITSRSAMPRLRTNHHHARRHPTGSYRRVSHKHGYADALDTRIAIGADCTVGTCVTVIAVGADKRPVRSRLGEVRKATEEPFRHLVEYIHPDLELSCFGG